MLEDVQEFILRTIVFSGALPCKITRPIHVYEAPGGERCTTITVPSTMEIAGTVSRVWHVAMQQYLFAQAEAVAPIWVITPSVMFGLYMCESERYIDQLDMNNAPLQSTYVYSLFLRKLELFSIRFIRQGTETKGPDDKFLHELVVQCGAPQAQGYGLSAQHIVELPAVCWVNVSEISDDDLEMFLAWRNDQLVDIGQLLRDTVLPLTLE